jgi:integrase
MKSKKTTVPNFKSNLTTMMDFFINFKKAQGLSERTLKDYECTFNQFKKVYPTNEIDMDMLKMKLLEFFQTVSNKAPATFNRPYANLHCFFDWCVQENFLIQNPLKSLGLKKRKDVGKVRHVDDEIIRKLLDTPDLTSYAGLRDYAIIILTLDTGIRPTEAFHLRTKDINFISNTVKIRQETAKTRVERVLPILPQTIEIIRRLISVKLDDWDDFIFFTIEGKQMNINRWEKRLGEYSKKIGCKVTPYMLRHCFSIMFLRNGGTTFALQMALGHIDLQMTKRYVKLMDSDIKEQHLTASPINNFLKRTTRVQKLFKNN